MRTGRGDSGRWHLCVGSGASSSGFAVVLPKRCQMAHVSRPLVGLLVSTLAFFAIWTVALKPGGSASGGGSQGLHSLSSAVAAAHHVAATSGAASAAESGVPSPSGSAAGRTSTVASTGSRAGTIRSSSANAAAAPSHGATPSPAGTAAVGSSQAATTTEPSPATAASQPGAARLKTALAAHEVVMLLFYNPSGADDQAVKQEVDAVRPRAGVLVLSAPITQLANYSSLTDQVPVSQSPTLLFIDRRGQASALTGFSDGLEIAQRLTDTLAVR